MKACNPITVLAGTVLLGCALCGCAAYSESRRCGGECAADARISSAVQQQIDQQLNLGGRDAIDVHTYDDVVYLSGRVLTDVQHESAIALARHTPGVRGVVDMLDVRARSGGGA
jgi:osmotically-inducible protein OsmY